MIHEKMIELEPLLEASGERNLRSIDTKHGECPCHGLAQTVWYPEHTNPRLVWDVELEPTNLRLLRSELAAAWADVSHALRGFYELADILIVLDEVLLLEISNLARQLKLNPEIRDNHPIISHLTASLWFRGMDSMITSSTSKARGPSNERKNVAAAERQLESMGTV